MKQTIYTDLTLYRAIAKVQDASYPPSEEGRSEVVADEWDWPMASEPAVVHLFSCAAFGRLGETLLSCPIAPAPAPAPSCPSSQSRFRLLTVLWATPPRSFLRMLTAGQLLSFQLKPA